VSAEKIREDALYYEAKKIPGRWREFERSLHLCGFTLLLRLWSEAGLIRVGFKYCPILVLRPCVRIEDSDVSAVSFKSALFWRAKGYPLADALFLSPGTENDHSAGIGVWGHLFRMAYPEM